MGEVARSIDKPPATILSYLQYHGGIRPRKRVRTSVALTFGEREKISRGLSAGCSIRSIARRLERHISTVSRETKRNGGIRRHRALMADKQAWKLSKNPKPSRFASNIKLKGIVSYKLTESWSPDQI